MKRTISAGEARQKLGEVLEGVFYRGDEVVVERAGKPMAVLVPARVYERILRQRERMLELMRKGQEANRNVPVEELERLVQEEIRADRKEQQQERRSA